MQKQKWCVILIIHLESTLFSRPSPTLFSETPICIVWDKEEEEEEEEEEEVHNTVLNVSVSLILY